MEAHEKYLYRCIELARNGFGNVSPNPMVGCVIVNNDKIIGEGYHIQYGSEHAEVNAINNIKNKKLLKSSTLYVNLEPCSHHGKTPPCTDLIIHYKIPDVVIGCIDSCSLVAGKGIKKLKEAGCNVKVKILEKECRELNKRFFTYHEKKRPYIILKWAQTLDGFIDIKRNENEKRRKIIKSNWITNDELKMLVHKWRSEEDAIMVGTNTAMNDNPELNVREWTGRNPLRVVLDEKLILPKKLHIFDKTTPTLIFTSIKHKSEKNIEYNIINFNKNIAQQILNKLYEKNIQSIIIEGGKQLLDTFIKADLWDEARVLIGNKIFIEGTKAPVLFSKPIMIQEVGNDKVLYLKH